MSIEKLKKASAFKTDEERYAHFGQVFDVHVDEYGIIDDPGKFEVEPYYSVYFYELMMLGDGELVDDEYDTAIMQFDITDEDIAIFPELEGYVLAKIYESDSGFIAVDIL